MFICPRPTTCCLHPGEHSKVGRQLHVLVLTGTTNLTQHFVAEQHNYFSFFTLTKTGPTSSFINIKNAFDAGEWQQ